EGGGGWGWEEGRAGGARGDSGEFAGHAEAGPGRRNSSRGKARGACVPPSPPRPLHVGPRPLRGGAARGDPRVPFRGCRTLALAAEGLKMATVRIPAKERRFADPAEIRRELAG